MKKKTTENNNNFTESQATIFEKLRVQMPSIYEEMQVIAKKTPDAPINTFKLKIINTLLEQANNILDKANKPFEYFEIFDENLLPTNSDVVMIIAQYIQCLKKFQSENVQMVSGTKYWVIDGQRTQLESNSFPFIKKP